MTEKWKSTIGIELQELLRQKGIRQDKLAEHLGLKAASVTYLLQGKIKLSHERLAQILVFLHADAAVIWHFEELWRNGNPQLKARSETNLARFCCRCKNGLTLDEICKRSGIAPERLLELENDPAAEPAIAEVETLKTLYGCEAGVLWGVLPAQEFSAPESEAAQVCEPKNELLRPVQLSLLDPSGLGYYREGCDFLEFLKRVRYGVETIECGKQERMPLAKVCFSSTRLGWDMKGRVEILLGMPGEEKTAGLYLGRGVHGIFRLWKRRGRFWTPFFSAFGEKKNKPEWFFPVISFKFFAEK